MATCAGPLQSISKPTISNRFEVFFFLPQAVLHTPSSWEAPWPSQVARCHHCVPPHCLGSWHQESSASHHHMQLSLNFPLSGPQFTQCWELGVDGSRCLNALCSCNSWNRWVKKGKPNPQTSGSVCEIVRFPNVSKLLIPLAFAVSRRSWRRSVPGRVQPRNTKEILTVCSANREYCWQRGKAGIRPLVAQIKQRPKGLSGMIEQLLRGIWDRSDPQFQSFQIIFAWIVVQR